MTQPPASSLQRFVAALFDQFLFTIVIAYLCFRVSLSTDLVTLLNSSLQAFLLLITLSLLYTFAHVLLTHYFGGTLGKLLTGLAVVDSEGRPLPLPRIFFRQYIGLAISSSLLFVGFVWVIFDRPNHRAWHDLLCDDYVVLRRKNLTVLAIFLTLVSLFLSLFLFTQAIANFSRSRDLYHQTFTDLSQELATPSPTPTPAAHTYTYGRLTIVIPTYLVPSRATPAPTADFAYDPVASFTPKRPPQLVNLLHISVASSPVPPTPQAANVFAQNYLAALRHRYPATEIAVAYPPTQTTIGPYPAVTATYQSAINTQTTYYLRIVNLYSGDEEYIFSSVLNFSPAALAEFDKILSSITFANPQ